MSAVFKKQGNPSCYRWALWSSPRIHTNPNYLMGKGTLNINNTQVHHETFLRHCVSTVLPPPVHELTIHTKLTQKIQFPIEAPHPICSNLFSPSMHPTHPLHLIQILLLLMKTLFIISSMMSKCSWYWGLHSYFCLQKQNLPFQDCFQISLSEEII